MVRSKTPGGGYSGQAQRSPTHPSPADRAESVPAVVFKAVSPLSGVLPHPDPSAGSTTSSTHAIIGAGQPPTSGLDQPAAVTVAAAAVIAEKTSVAPEARLLMTLDHDYDVVCKQGKNRYTQQLQVDLAAALRVPQGRIEVLELARGSVKATIALYDSGSGPAPLALVLELQRQLADPGSALKQGKVSCKALAIQSLALPGSAVGSSRVSEIGEDFVEELDGILSAHEFTKEDVAPSHKEVNILLWAACPCSADKEMCGLVQVPERHSPAGTSGYLLAYTLPSNLPYPT